MSFDVWKFEMDDEHVNDYKWDQWKLCIDHQYGVVGKACILTLDQNYIVSFTVTFAEDNVMWMGLGTHGFIKPEMECSDEFIMQL